MASAANDSHATSSATDEENWKYVECGKCREEAILQDKEDPNNHTLRPDFHLTACGHVVCEKCLQASAAQDGSQLCPKCQLPLQDWISLQDAQNVPSLAPYFQSVENMLAKMTQAIRYQTTNLRDQVTYYKSIAHKQSAALKGAKKELAELRSMKKNYDALQRENTALKNQLAGGPQVNTTPLMQPHINQEPRLQTNGPHPHPSARPSTIPVPAPARVGTPQQQFLPRLQDNHMSSRHVGHVMLLDSTNDPVQARPSSRMPSHHLDNQQGFKRNAEAAGLSFPPSNLPPRMRESQLPSFAMSSAQLQDPRRQEEYQDDQGTEEAGVERLQSFRFQAGQGSAQIPRTASRQAPGPSPREAGYAPRRSSSRSSRSDLPAIEETPFQRNSIRSDEAHLPEAGPSRRSLPPPPVEPNQRYTDQSHGNHQNDYNAREAQSYQNPGQTFVQASALQPAPGFHQSEEGRYSTFRPLVARLSTNNVQHSNNPPQSRQNYISPPVNQQQRPFQPVPTARPATAQAGSNTQNQQFGRAPTQSSRPATAQGGRRFSQASSSNAIRPMAIPSRNNGGSKFRYQPEG